MYRVLRLWCAKKSANVAPSKAAVAGGMGTGNVSPTTTMESINSTIREPTANARGRSIGGWSMSTARYGHATWGEQQRQEGQQDEA